MCVLKQWETGIHRKWMVGGSTLENLIYSTFFIIFFSTSNRSNWKILVYQIENFLNFSKHILPLFLALSSYKQKAKNMHFFWDTL